MPVSVFVACKTEQVYEHREQTHIKQRWICSTETFGGNFIQVNDRLLRLQMELKMPKSVSAKTLIQIFVSKINVGWREYIFVTLHMHI